MNATLARLETQQTKANTNFMAWWATFNSQLKTLGLFDATYGPAKGYYEVGHSPETAAADMAVVLEDQATA